MSHKRGCNQTGSRPQAGNTRHGGIEVEESVMELEGEKVIPGQGDSIQTHKDRSWYRRSVERRRKACRRNKRRGQNRSAARQQDRWKRDHTRYSDTESTLTQSAIAANLAMVQSTATLTPVHVNTTITITGNGHGKPQDNRDRKRHRKSQRLRRQERDRREKQARLEQESTTIREQIKKICQALHTATAWATHAAAGLACGVWRCVTRWLTGNPPVTEQPQPSQVQLMLERDIPVDYSSTKEQESTRHQMSTSGKYATRRAKATAERRWHKLQVLRQAEPPTAVCVHTSDNGDDAIVTEGSKVRRIAAHHTRKLEARNVRKARLTN